MPQKLKQKTTALPIRASAGKRKSKPQPGRKQGNRSKAPVAAGSIGSLFTVRLAPKPAYQLQEEVSPFEAPVSDISSDLLQSLNHALKAIGKPELVKNKATLKGLDVLQHCLNTLNAEVLPEGFEYNIEKEEGRYYFVLYKSLHIDWHWHYFAIEPIVKYLERTDLKLMQLYLSAINVLRKQVDISAWFSGVTYTYGMMTDQCWFDDFVNNQLGNGTEEEDNVVIDSWEKERENYLKGEIKQYEKKICSAHLHLPSLLRQLNKYNANNRVVVLIKKILLLANTGLSLKDFDYDPYYNDHYDGDPLTLDQQLTIIWTENDEPFKVECEYIDVHAGEFGVKEPTISIVLNHKVKKNDFEGFDTKQSFLKELTKLWHFNYDLTRKLHKQNERFNKKLNG